MTDELRPTTIDPITLEIALHRLWQINQEMAIALTRTSGSVVTIDSKDYMTALYDAGGNCVMSGSGVIFHSGVFAHAVKYLIDEKADELGIYEGDVYILNDPYIAPLHQADTSLFAPIFYEGEMVGWSVTMTHMVDIGGIDPGGSCPNARSVYQEGLRFPGVKLVDRGELRRDVFNFFLNNVRDPGMVGLDLKAQLAAAETARKRVMEMVAAHGIETYRELCRLAINYAEMKFRARLRELPDGAWSARVYLDGGAITGDIYKVVLAMTKQDDHLVFDFTGTSEQVPFCINTTLHGARGGVFGALAPLLAYDVPWNQGLLNCFEVRVPEGTLVSARFPAPVSMATIGGAFLVSDAAIMAISSMLGCSEKYRDEATAQWSSSSPGIVVSGLNKQAQPFVSIMMEALCGGAGGMRHHDGEDIAGKPWTPENIHPNVETLEQQLPVLYLYRRMVRDSAGAGQFRGGLAGELAFKAYDNPGGNLDVSIFGMGDESLLGHGLFGGYPSQNVRPRIKRDTDFEQCVDAREMPEELDSLAGALEAVPALWIGHLGRNDVLNVQYNGGGGYGDPLERPAALVARDVADGAISLQTAGELYGTVIDPGTMSVDDKATELKRQDIRRQRLGGRVPRPVRDGSNAPYRPVGEYLEVLDRQGGAVIVCRRCGVEFGLARENFKERAVMSEYSLQRSSPNNSATQRFVLREFYCPGCATLLEVEVAKKDDPILPSVLLL